jgi:hypothetical protein
MARVTLGSEAAVLARFGRIDARNAIVDSGDPHLG